MSKLQSLDIRFESSDDPREIALIHAVNKAAFGGSEESDLVDELRASGHMLISLVAEVDSVLVGHILFSRMAIDTASGLVSAVALAPVAVHPDYQRLGIGSALIRHGLNVLRDHGERIVVVLGHAEYYQRFGFSTDLARSLQSPFPPESYLAIELVEGALQGIRGTVVYPPPFRI